MTNHSEHETRWEPPPSEPGSSAKVLLGKAGTSYQVQAKHMDVAPGSDGLA